MNARFYRSVNLSFTFVLSEFKKISGLTLMNRFGLYLVGVACLCALSFSHSSSYATTTSTTQKARVVPQTKPRPSQAGKSPAMAALPPELAKAWATTGLPDSTLSLVVQDVDGSRLFEQAPNQPRNPASVMKLVTTWAAISSLGPNYVWNTAFLIDANSKINEQGVLNGPVYLRPSGDPLFLLEDLWRLMRELRLRGVKQISDIVVDRSRFADVAIDPAAFDGKGDRPYNASPDVFMVGFGAVRVVLSPDLQTDKWRAFVDPPVAEIDAESKVQWLPGKCSTSPQVGADIITMNNEMRFRINGKAQGACGEFDIYRLAFTQEEFAARALRSMWKEVGGEMTGQVISGAIPPTAVPIAAHDSPPLSEVIRFINKSSNNVMTRVLLLTMGAEAGQRPATVAGSAQWVTQQLQKQGVDVSGLAIENGSGLARDTAVSANGLATMMQRAWDSPVMPEYLSSLALLGNDGTMRNRLKSPATRLRAHMKTGALRDVRAAAGYVLGNSGKRYIMVSMVNDDQAYRAREFENAVIAWLIKN